MRWVKVETILNTWKSTDATIDSREDWDHLLARKRRDHGYKDIKKSIQKYGFCRPSDYLTRSHYWSQGKTPTHHEGHHRLAAAIDLGYKYVPYIARGGKSKSHGYCSHMYSRSTDSEHIVKCQQIYSHPENPKPLIII